MESSASSFSDVSSCSSASAVQVFPVAPSNMSFAVQRSDLEMKMIDVAVSSLMNTVERYSHHLTDTEYAFYCRYGTDFLNGEMNRKARKAMKNGMDNTMRTMVDASIDLGSVRSYRPVPLHQIHPSNALHNPRYARAPSTVSSVSEYRRRPVFERYTQAGLSSGYSSRMPSVDPRKNGTLIQAIEEAQEPEELENANGEQRLHGRPELPTPTSSSADDGHIDERAFKNKVSTAVPNHIKIFNWSLTLTGEELCVAGYSIDKSKITAGAVKKYTHPVVVTSKGSFLVIGQPCFKERTPAFIKCACSKGFPRMWKMLTRKWIADRQSRKKSTPKNTPERKNKYTASGKKKKDESTGTPTNVVKSRSNPDVSLKKKKQRDTPENEDESIVSPVAAKQAKVKSRSNPDVSLKKKKKRDEPEDEDESIVSPVAAKQAKPKVKSRSNPDVSLKKKNKRDGPEDEDESIVRPAAAKQAKPKVKSRSNPDVSLKKKTKRDEPEDEDESIVSPVAAKQAKPKVKSRSNLDVSLKKKKKRDEPEDEDESIVSPVAAKQAKVKSRSNLDVSLKKKKKRDEPEDEDESIVSPVAAKQAKPKVKSRSNPEVTLKEKKQRDEPEDQRDERPKKPVDLFGDDSDTGVPDAFSALGGDYLLSFPCPRSMTPNTLVANIQPDAGMIGRYTPPLQNVLNLFAANNQKTNSTLGSPSSLNNSRDNPVSKRVAKVVEATKKGGKKQKKLPELGAPDELTGLVESLKSTNTQKTPNIIKKMFRNQRENDDDESEPDESMVY